MDAASYLGAVDHVGSDCRTMISNWLHDRMMSESAGTVSAKVFEPAIWKSKLAVVGTSDAAVLPVKLWGMCARSKDSPTQVSIIVLWVWFRRFCGARRADHDNNHQDLCASLR
jgi:hypothetical protein